MDGDVSKGCFGVGDAKKKCFSCGCCEFDRVKELMHIDVRGYILSRSCPTKKKCEGVHIVVV